MTVGSFGTLLQCNPAYLVVINCCQIEQHLSTSLTDNLGVLDEANCQSFGVTSENKEAGGSEHNPWGVGDNEVWISPPRCSHYSHTICPPASDSGQFTNWLEGIDFSRKVSNLEGGRGGKVRKIKYKEREAICLPLVLVPI